MDDSSALCWTESGWMTANDPLLSQEAVNHCDAELPGESNRGNTPPKRCPFGRVRPEEACASAKLDELSKGGLMIPSRCECPHSSPLQERFVRPSISTHDRSGDVVQKPPVRTSAQVMARFRRWFRCPPLCQRDGLNLAQPLAPTSRDP